MVPVLVSVALAGLAVASAGCFGLGDEREFGFPGHKGIEAVPPLFGDETWNFTIGWTQEPDAGRPDVAKEAGVTWLAGDHVFTDAQRRGDLDPDAIPGTKQVAATDLEAWAEVPVGLQAPTPGHHQLASYLVLDDRAALYPLQEVHVMERGETHTVRIGEVPAGPLSEWSDTELGIAQGDAVVWVNDDAVAPHDATSIEASAHNAFATATLQPGESSEPVWFREPGEVVYFCSIHPDTMDEAAITVS